MSVLTDVEHELQSIMPVKKARDTSNMLLCPMPGTVLEYAVREGDVVPPGGLLCILEAMKMQVLFVQAEACVRVCAYD